MPGGRLNGMGWGWSVWIVFLHLAERRVFGEEGESTTTTTQGEKSITTQVPQAEGSSSSFGLMIFFLVLLIIVVLAFIYYCYKVGAAEKERRRQRNESIPSTMSLPWRATVVDDPIPECTYGATGYGIKKRPSESDVGQIESRDGSERSSLRINRSKTRGSRKSDRASFNKDEDRFAYKTVTDRQKMAELEALEDERRGIVQQKRSIHTDLTPLGYYKEIETPSDREVKQMTMALHRQASSSPITDPHDTTSQTSTYMDNSMTAPDNGSTEEDVVPLAPTDAPNDRSNPIRSIQSGDNDPNQFNPYDGYQYIHLPWLPASKRSNPPDPGPKFDPTPPF